MSACGCRRSGCRLPVGDTRHGTTNGYSNLGCGCQACRDAWAAYTYDLRRRRPALPPGDARHGRATTYQNWRCRCPRCRSAQAREHGEGRSA